MFASGPVGFHKTHRNAKESLRGLRGMAMKTKEKLLLVWILVLVAIGILFSHFCGGAVDALEHFVACSLVSPPGLASFSAGLLGIHILP
jgi:hypothetical protein